MIFLRAIDCIWFLDDPTIGDSPEKVIENILTVLPKLRFAGLEWKSSEYELVMFRHETAIEVTSTTDLFQEILSYIKVLKDSEFSFLGASLTVATFKPALESKVQKLSRTNEILTCLEPHQCLTFSFAI